MLKSSQQQLAWPRAAYLLSLLPALLTIAGILLGAWWTLSATVFLAALAVPDWRVKSWTVLGDEGVFPDATLFAQAVLQTASVAAFVGGILSHTIGGWFVVNAIISTGLALGAGGLTAAHELIHRHDAQHRWTGVWLCFLARSSHYYIEHLQGHHRHIGLADDPTTDRRVGESLVSRLMLLEIGRHSDHHCHSERHFPDLAAREFSPELPAGTFGLFPLVLLPPLWSAFAHRLLQHPRKCAALGIPR